MDKTKILIAGIGGVGGYFGGLLAQKYYNNDQIEVYFLARGKHLKKIQEKGLRVIIGAKDFIARPKIASDDPNAFGTMDHIIVCTKSYGLEETIEMLKPCIDDKTVILPLLNGVDSRERITAMLPYNLVLEGCVYIISRLTQAGTVENLGNIQKLFFGLDNFENEKLTELQEIFLSAGIEATLSTNISSIIWEKYIFISSVATATSYYDTTIGAILADRKKMKILSDLITEVSEVAKAKKMAVSEDIAPKTLNKIKSLPYEMTSSMHSDFQNKNHRTELRSLTNYVVKEGCKLGIKIPTYHKLYIELEAVVTNF
ncbi:ketopantoate reductase family protein [Spongiimicrobium sp. 3-5]|uniref:ketopantoate reductase family protein n=1 Tax=Spongiimicrobium sp. 3-5 TaxID=3332596 RepID=UPI0039809671